VNLLLAAILLVQDKTAEEIFKKIEEMIEQADSISIRLKYRMILDSGKGLPTKEEETTAVILLNKENKVVVSVEPSPMFDGGRSDMKVLSDGDRLVVTDESGKTASGTTPKSLGTGFKTILARMGYFGAQWLVPRSPRLPPPVIGGQNPAKLAPKEEKDPDLKKFLERDLKKDFQITDLKAFTEDGEHLLRYSLKQGKGEALEMTLWYDPKTYKPLKRRYVLAGLGTLSIVQLETYVEFSTNADIPDEKFKLPEQKK
jgi:outer membrane lipoprotein-sorting protein